MPKIGNGCATRLRCRRVLGGIGLLCVSLARNRKGQEKGFDRNGWTANHSRMAHRIPRYRDYTPTEHVRLRPIRARISLCNHMFCSWSRIWLLFFPPQKNSFDYRRPTFLYVNVGLFNKFHPSRSGYFVTYGSLAGLLLLFWWRARKRMQLGGKYPGVEGMHKLFDKDHGDEL